MSNKVFVGGLSWNTTEAGLEDYLSEVGEITEVKIIQDRETGRSRGFGFVTFAEKNAADQAVERFDGTEFDGRNIKVNIAEDRRPDRGGNAHRGGNRDRNRW
ncbi:MAG: RNA-binding protein [Deltaproteobacteria bacterium]|nr:RNA-binding protein [Deltaproteobacteria bacterium]